MSGHTPGPWRVFVDRVDRDGLVHIAGYNIESATTEVVGTEGISGQDNAEADARLIAAAPDLLENLQGCLEALASYAPDCIEVECARAAIAKATGGAA